MKNPDSVKKFWKSVLPRLVKLLPVQFPKLSQWNRQHTVSLIDFSILRTFKKGQQIDLTNGIILVQGDISYQRGSDAPKTRYDDSFESQLSDGAGDEGQEEEKK